MSAQAICLPLARGYPRFAESGNGFFAEGKIVLWYRFYLFYGKIASGTHVFISVGCPPRHIWESIHTPSLTHYVKLEPTHHSDEHIPSQSGKKLSLLFFSSSQSSVNALKSTGSYKYTEIEDNDETWQIISDIQFRAEIEDITWE